MSGLPVTLIATSWQQGARASARELRRKTARSLSCCALGCAGTTTRPVEPGWLMPCSMRVDQTCREYRSRALLQRRSPGVSGQESQRLRVRWSAVQRLSLGVLSRHPRDVLIAFRASLSRLKGGPRLERWSRTADQLNCVDLAPSDKCGCAPAASIGWQPLFGLLLGSCHFKRCSAASKKSIQRLPTTVWRIILSKIRSWRASLALRGGAVILTKNTGLHEMVISLPLPQPFPKC